MKTCDKKTYNSEMEAYLALETVQMKGLLRIETDGRKPHRIYKCHVCKKYHLTSKKLKQ
jgi:hypothetical protein